MLACSKNEDNISVPIISATNDTQQYYDHSSEDDNVGDDVASHEERVFNPLSDAQTYSYYRPTETSTEDAYYRHVNLLSKRQSVNYFRVGMLYPTTMSVSDIRALGIEPNYNPATQSSSALLDMNSIVDVDTVDKYRSVYSNQNGGFGGNFNFQNFGFSLAYGHKTSGSRRYELEFQFYQGISNIDGKYLPDSNGGIPSFNVNQYSYVNGVLAPASMIQYNVVQTVMRHVGISGNMFHDFDYAFSESSIKFVRKFVPYVGAGLGLSTDFGYMRAGTSIYTTTSLFSNPSGETRTPVSYNNFGLMGQLLAGMQYKMSSMVDLDLRYGYQYGRHFSSPNVTTNVSSYSAGLSPLTYNIQYVQLSMIIYLGAIDSANVKK